MTLSSTNRAWRKFGDDDPYFGVLSQPRFRRELITEADLEAFLADIIRAWLTAYRYPPQSEYFVDDLAPNPEWNALLIAANDATDPMDVTGYANKIICFLSTVSGTLTIQVEEPDGTYNDFDVVGVTADIMKSYPMPEQATNIILSFSQAAIVTAILVRGVA